MEGLADDDQFVEELDPCAICCEELSSGLVQVLECGHRYHDQVTALSVVFLRTLLKSLPRLLFFLGCCQNRYYDCLLFSLVAVKIATTIICCFSLEAVKIATMIVVFP